MILTKVGMQAASVQNLAGVGVLGSWGAHEGHMEMLGQIGLDGRSGGHCTFVSSKKEVRD